MLILLKSIHMVCFDKVSFYHLLCICNTWFKTRIHLLHRFLLHYIYLGLFYVLQCKSLELFLQCFHFFECLFELTLTLLVTTFFTKETCVIKWHFFLWKIDSCSWITSFLLKHMALLLLPRLPFFWKSKINILFVWFSFL